MTSEVTPTIGGVPLKDGGEIVFRGRRWKVELKRESVVDRYVLTPMADAA